MCMCERETEKREKEGERVEGGEGREGGGEEGRSLCVCITSMQGPTEIEPGPLELELWAV